MFNELVMDAKVLGALLEALAESLRSPRGGPSSPAELAADLRTMGDTARAWAEQHRIPVSCVPREPGPDVTNEQGAEFLSALGKAVRYLAPHAAPPGNMAEVVDVLRARQAPALLELAELDFAVKELVPRLVAVEETVGAVAAELQITSATAREASLRDAADHAHEILRQLVAALRELEKGVACWGVMPKHTERSPSSSTRPS